MVMVYTLATQNTAFVRQNKLQQQATSIQQQLLQLLQALQLSGLQPLTEDRTLRRIPA